MKVTLNVTVELGSRQTFGLWDDNRVQREVQLVLEHTDNPLPREVWTAICAGFVEDAIQARLATKEETSHGD